VRPNPSHGTHSATKKSTDSKESRLTHEASRNQVIVIRAKEPEPEAGGKASGIPENGVLSPRDDLHPLLRKLDSMPDIGPVLSDKAFRMQSGTTQTLTDPSLGEMDARNIMSSGRALNETLSKRRLRTLEDEAALLAAIQVLEKNYVARMHKAAAVHASFGRLSAGLEPSSFRTLAKNLSSACVGLNRALIGIEALRMLLPSKHRPPPFKYQWSDWRSGDFEKRGRNVSGEDIQVANNDEMELVKEGSLYKRVQRDAERNMEAKDGSETADCNASPGRKRRDDKKRKRVYAAEFSYRHFELYACRRKKTVTPNGKNHAGSSNSKGYYVLAYFLAKGMDRPRGLIWIRSPEQISVTRTKTRKSSIVQEMSSPDSIGSPNPKIMGTRMRVLSDSTITVCDGDIRVELKATTEAELNDWVVALNEAKYDDPDLNVGEASAKTMHPQSPSCNDISYEEANDGNGETEILI